MFWGYWIIISFIVGLPISFGIGSLIGYIVCKVSKVQQRKGKIIILSGISYIISQPISYIVGAFLEVGVFNVFFLLPFALGFTIIISILIVQLSKYKGKMKKEKKEKKLLFVIRSLVIFFMLSLVISGVTAFPLETEIKILGKIIGIFPDVSPETYSGLKGWIATVKEGIINTNSNYPFLAYGTDWLAFSHIVIAIAFIGLYIDPVRNKWIIYFGMIACLGVIPLALICGAIRKIPFYWQLIDCSFGVFGCIPLYLMHRYVNKLEKITLARHSVQKMNGLRSA
jgi:hypothetical protein